MTRVRSRLDGAVGVLLEIDGERGLVEWEWNERVWHRLEDVEPLTLTVAMVGGVAVVVNDVIERIGKNMARIRQERGQSQDEFGESCGLTRDQVTNYEQARRRITVDAFVYMCAKLQLDMREFLR